VVAEDAVENLFLVLAEVVIAQAAGEAEFLRRREGHLAEQRELIEFVLEIGEEQRVFWRAEAACRYSADVLEPCYRQTLRIVPIGMAEEGARNPGNLIASAGDSHFLRPYVCRGGIIQRRVGGVGRRWEPQAAAGDACRQRRGVTNDQEVAVGVGRHRS